MKRRLVALVMLVSLLLSAVTPMLALAANAVLSLGLLTESCSGGTLDISVTLDSAAVREGGQATLSDGTVLRQFEHASGASTSYSGVYGYGGWTTQPDGTIISLYGYIGQTPPSSADSVEFFLAYRCNTGDVIATCSGPAGSCPKTYVPPAPAEVCPNVLDGRLNNSGAVDCAAPIVLFHTGDRLDVYGVGGGLSKIVFSIPDSAIVSGSTDLLASGLIAGTGQIVSATLLGDGRLLLEASYEDGKPYTIVYDPTGSPTIVHIAA